MIITDLEAVRQDCGILLRYVADPAKTKIPEGKEDPYAELADLYGNICRGEHDGSYVTGINVDPDSSENEFTRTLSLFPREDGVHALHTVQSFEPGEISAEEAHAFGVRLACTFCEERYEAVVATHTDHMHFHNHIVFNAVSWTDGSELKDSKQNLRILRRQASMLAPSFGIVKEKISSEPGSREENTAMHALREVSEAVALSRSFREFRTRMAQRGYSYHSLAQPVLVMQNGQTLELGGEYSEELLREQIYEEKQKRERPSFLQADISGLHGIQILYFRYLNRVLGLPEDKIPEAFQDLKTEKEAFEEEAYFLIRNGISNNEDLGKEKALRERKLQQCRKERERLTVSIYRSGESEDREYLLEVRELLKQDQEILKEEIALCDRIADHTTLLEDRFRSYDKGRPKEKERKEER